MHSNYSLFSWQNIHQCRPACLLLYSSHPHPILPPCLLTLISLALDFTLSFSLPPPSLSALVQTEIRFEVRVLYFFTFCRFRVCVSISHICVKYMWPRVMYVSLSVYVEYMSGYVFISSGIDVHELCVCVCM